MDKERAIVATSRALSRRRISRTVIVALFATLIQIASGSLTPAAAAGTPVVTMPANGWVIGQNATTTLSGVSVSGLGASDTYLITVALNGTYTGSTLKIGTTTNLTASYGYSASTFTSFTKISFTGIAADINAALATLQYIAGTAQVSGTTPSVSVSAVENLSGLAFNPANNHYYRAVKYTDATKPSDNAHSTAMTWAQTQSFAGLNGYLVTITSSDENSFVASTIPNASNIWIGARDNWSGGGYTFGEGYWGWASPGSPEYGAGFSYDSTASSGVTIDGSTKRYVSSGRTTSGSYTSVNTAITMAGANGGSSNGYSNWCSGEPNNVSGEHMAVTNWSGGTCWNDLPDSYGSVQGLVIEWGSNAADGGFTNAVTSSAKVYLAPTISRITGNNQIGQLSTALSGVVTVQLVDSMGTVIPSATISWSATRGSVLSATSTTNVLGRASQNQWIMPASTGLDTLTASYSGAGNPSISFTARVSSYSIGNTETDTAMTTSGTRYLTISNSSTLLPGTISTMTLEAWVRPSATCDGNVACTVMTIDKSYLLQVANGKIRYYIGSGSAWCNANASKDPVDANVPGGQWTHITFVRVNANVKIYINGQLRSDLNSSCSPTTQAANSNAFVIGAKGANSEPFIGHIDEVRMWSTDRSSNAASDMHSNETSTSGLVAYWNMNEGAGGVAYNQVPEASSSSDLTVSDSTAWDSTVVSLETAGAAYTTRTFYRTFITSNGGWRAPTPVSRFSALVVAGGGGGGYNSGGGGSGGGILHLPLVDFAGVQQVTVGVGGAGSDSTGTTATVGGNSILGSNTVTGGNRGGNYPTSQAGGSGIVTATGTSGAGGAGAASASVSGTAGSAGISNSISGASTTYGGGGGGGGWGGNTGGGAGGSGGGGAGGITNSQFGKNGTANLGGGGGAGSSSGSASGNGGSGVIIIRWLTASKPIFTQPTIDTTTAGIIDTITVSNDPASPLTRSFKWQSSSDTGTTWSDISTGSGFTTQTYSTPVLETTTSGARYQYRVIVTDSDTAGLLIRDTSTAVYIVINPRIQISGNATSQKYGATHVDTFTAVTNTGTGNKTFTFSPNNRSGITWNGATANQATLTIARTLGPGTYLETMTATDTKGASTQYGISIVVSKADTITVTSLARTDTYTGSALSFTPGYTITGLQNSDTVTSISWSYSGTENSTSAYGPSATKPVNAGSYQITPSAVISNSDSYTAVVSETSTLTINRATRTITGSVSPSPLKFGASGTLSATPSAGSGDGAVTYTTSTTDSCTVSSANLQALKSSGTCSFIARIAQGNNHESATSTSVSLSLAKADTLTVSVNAITPVTYTGNPANVSPTVTVSGLQLSNGVGASPVSISYVGQGNVGSTCAQGGPCAVGDTGPGGGKVFYVAASQQSWGRYLEAAPANWSGGADNQASNISKWCVATPSVDGTVFTGLFNGFGNGYVNTYDSRLNVCTGGAIYKARSYRGGGYSNWYLPNSTELTIMAGSSIRSMIGLVDDASLWGYWGSQEAQDTGYIGSLVTAGWGIGATVKGETGKNMTRPIRAFSEGEIATVTYPTPPTDAGTYAVKASSLALSSGSLSDYQGVTYTDGSLLINRAQQSPLVIAQYAAVFGTPYLIMIYGGSGTGAVTETVTAGTALGCTINGDTLTSTTVGTCQLFATKARDKNYETATATAFVYFLNFVTNQPTASPSSGSQIALGGVTSIDTSTVQPPSISGLSTLTLSLGAGGTFTITGTGFTGSISVKFWRNKVLSVTSGNGTTISIPVSSIASSGATSGRISVITDAGQAVSIDSLTITP